MVRGLVQEQNVRRLDQGFGNGEPLAPSARERRGMRIKIRKTRAAQCFGKTRGSLGFGNGGAFESSLNGGTNRHARRKLRNLGDGTEPRPLANRHVPAVRFDATDEHLQQRRLTRTIRPNHADAVPFGNGK